jgi:hypothetical protein
MSKRAIARQFGISRDSVDKMIVYSVPPLHIGGPRILGSELRLVGEVRRTG